MLLVHCVKEIIPKQDRSNVRVILVASLQSCLVVPSFVYHYHCRVHGVSVISLVPECKYDNIINIKAIHMKHTSFIFDPILSRFSLISGCSSVELSDFNCLSI